MRVELESVSEQKLERRLLHFKKLLGIADEGNIVSDDDYESSLAVSYEEIRGAEKNG